MKGILGVVHICLTYHKVLGITLGVEVEIPLCVLVGVWGMVGNGNACVDDEPIFEWVIVHYISLLVGLRVALGCLLRKHICELVLLVDGMLEGQDRLGNPGIGTVQSS